MIEDWKRVQKEQEDRKWERYEERLLNELPPMRELSHKTMIALAGGALALSITFLGNVMNAVKLFAPYYLFWSWVCLAISLLLAVANLIAGIQMRDHKVKAIAQGKRESLTNNAKRFEWLAGNKITYATFALLLSGFVLMGVFLNLNIKGKIANEQITALPAAAATTTAATTGAGSDKEGLDTSTRTPSAAAFTLGRTAHPKDKKRKSKSHQDSSSTDPS